MKLNPTLHTLQYGLITCLVAWVPSLALRHVLQKRQRNWRCHAEEAKVRVALQFQVRFSVAVFSFLSTFTGVPTTTTTTHYSRTRTQKHQQDDLGLEAKQDRPYWRFLAYFLAAGLSIAMIIINILFTIDYNTDVQIERVWMTKKAKHRNPHSPTTTTPHTLTHTQFCFALCMAIAIHFVLEFVWVAVMYRLEASYYHSPDHPRHSLEDEPPEVHRADDEGERPNFGTGYDRWTEDEIPRRLAESRRADAMAERSRREALEEQEGLLAASQSRRQREEDEAAAALAAAEDAAAGGNSHTPSPAHRGPTGSSGGGVGFGGVGEDAWGHEDGRVRDPIDWGLVRQSSPEVRQRGGGGDLMEYDEGRETQVMPPADQLGPRLHTASGRYGNPDYSEGGPATLLPPTGRGRGAIASASASASAAYPPPQSEPWFEQPPMVQQRPPSGVYASTGGGGGDDGLVVSSKHPLAPPPVNHGARYRHLPVVPQEDMDLVYGPPGGTPPQGEYELDYGPNETVDRY